MTLSNDVDLLNPPAEVEKRKYKLKRLVQSPNSFFFFMVTHKLCDLSSTIEMKKMNGGKACLFCFSNERLVWRTRDGDEDEDEKNDEIDYKRLKSDTMDGCATGSVPDQMQLRWYVVPTGRVVVPTGRYVVPAGKVIIIVSPGVQAMILEYFFSYPSAFVVLQVQSKMTYPDQSQSTTYNYCFIIPSASSNVIESVLQSFVAKILKKKAGRNSSLIPKMLPDQRNWINQKNQMLLVSVDSMLNCQTTKVKILEKELKKDFDNLEVQYKECFIQVQAYKSSLQNLEQQKSWYQNNQLALEEKIRILTADLANTNHMLKYTEKLNEQAKSGIIVYNKVKLEESEARFDKWKNSSKNLNKLINSSMSSRSKFGLGYGDTFGTDEVFDLSAPSIFDSCLKDAIEKPLYDGFTSSSKTNEPLASASSSVDLQTSHKTDDQGPCNVTPSPSFSFTENVKTPRNLYCDFYENQLRLNNAPVWKNVENIPSFVPRPAYVPAGSRNRPTSVPAGRPFPAGWHNPAARPMTRPKSHYFQQFSRPGSYNQMDMDGGRWGTAVKTSAGCSWQSNRPYMHWGSKNNGGSHQSTGNE
ncbi:ribonuclease H-like domain-containing protein [Tanacetum coccineum]